MFQIFTRCSSSATNIAAKIGDDDDKDDKDDSDDGTSTASNLLDLEPLKVVIL